MSYDYPYPRVKGRIVWGYILNKKDATFFDVLMYTFRRDIATEKYEKILHKYNHSKQKIKRSI